MKKIFKLAFVFILSLVCIFNVYAEASYPNEVKSALREFVSMLNTHDDVVYNYIDVSNEAIYSNIEKYLDNINLTYTIKDVKDLHDDTYEVIIKFDAKGFDDVKWNISGINASFKIKKIDGNYVIVDTDFFDKIGSENVIKFVSSIFKIAWLAALGFFGFCSIVVVIIILIILSNKKKKESQNPLNEEVKEDKENESIKLN